jgi:hypothetical protein
MPTDAERWRFLADHKLTLHTDNGDYGYMVHWVRTGGPGQPPRFYPVSTGATADEAIDRAIERYNRKHKIQHPPVSRENSSQSERGLAVQRVPVRGWVT